MIQPDENAMTQERERKVRDYLSAIEILAPSVAEALYRLADDRAELVAEVARLSVSEPRKAYYDNPVMIDGIPRSHPLDQLTPAEKAIQFVIDVVEAVGADPLLTDAVILLGDAQRKVAEYVDRQLQRESAV